jgi:hypothetical protein
MELSESTIHITEGTNMTTQNEMTRATPTPAQIRETVAALLTGYGLEYSANGGERIHKPAWDKTSKPWDCYAWRVTFGTAPGNGPRKSVTFDYYCGLGHTKVLRPMPNPPYRKGTLAYEEWERNYVRAKAPEAADVLHSLVLDAESANMSFYDWCSEYGLDEDSRNAEAAHYACCDTARKLREVFTREQIAALADAVREL